MAIEPKFERTRSPFPRELIRVKIDDRWAFTNSTSPAVPTRGTLECD